MRLQFSSILRSFVLFVPSSITMLLGAAAAAATATTAVAYQNPSLFASSSCCSSFYQRQRQRQRSTSLSQLPLISSVLKLRGSAAPFLLSPWTGTASLQQLRLPSLRLIEKRGKFRRKAPHASLFGVGAPEALVIGVVALLVFGPKGLAEVARNLGKTLRAFQPTIKELQDVSREFKSTLEREIGLDEVSSPANNTYNANSFSNQNQQVMTDPNGTPKSGAYTSEDLLKITQEQLAATATATESQAPETSEDPLKITQEQLAATATATESQTPETIPEGQQELPVPEAVADEPSKVTATTTPEVADQTKSSEKIDKER